MNNHTYRTYSAYSMSKEYEEVDRASSAAPAPKMKQSLRKRVARLFAAPVLALAVATGAGLAVAPAASATPVWSSDEQQFVTALATDHDTERANRNLTPLHRDTRLDDAAQLWAQQMATNSNSGAGASAMVHSNTAGTSSPLYFAVAIYPGWSQAAENICYDATTNQSATQRGHIVFNAFMNSAPHRATILTDRYETIGYGVATDNQGRFFCSVLFGDYFAGGYVAPSVPSAVTNLATYANSDGSVSVTFTAPAGTVTGYEVSTDGGNTFTSWNGTSALTGLTVGQSYDVAVRALNSVGTGVASAVSTVVPQQTNIGGNPPVVTPPSIGGGGGVSFGGGSGGGAPAPETGTPEKGNTVTTVAGSSRFGTSVALAQKTNAAPEMVVIASGDQARLIDSVSAAPFAKSINAPLLLTTSGGLSREVHDYITATPSIKGAVVVGGQQAVSDQVWDDLRGLGLTNLRINGADRYSTSAMLAQKTLLNTGGSKVFITRGSGSLSDAVSASGTASGLGAAVLIVPNSTENLDGWSRSFVQNKIVVAVGGTDVLPLSVASEMGAVERVSGATRYETSQAVAGYAVAHGVKADRAFVANGAENRLVDALAAGSVGSISLLVAPEGFGSDVTKWLSDNKTSEVIAVGGLTPTR